MLETVRISAAGYPSRWEYEDFIARYSMLLRSSEIDENEDIKEQCKTILHKGMYVYIQAGSFST